MRLGLHPLLRIAHNETQFGEIGGGVSPPVVNDVYHTRLLCDFGDDCQLQQEHVHGGVG